MLNNYDVLLDGGRDIKVGGACDFYTFSNIHTIINVLKL